MSENVAPTERKEKVWTGNFTEDRRKWPKLTLDEIYAGAARIEAAHPERLTIKPVARVMD
jgi:hypothetical protein